MYGASHTSSTGTERRVPLPLPLPLPPRAKRSPSHRCICSHLLNKCYFRVLARVIPRGRPTASLAGPTSRIMVHGYAIEPRSSVSACGQGPSPPVAESLLCAHGSSVGCGRTQVHSQQAPRPPPHPWLMIMIGGAAEISRELQTME